MDLTNRRESIEKVVQFINGGISFGTIMAFIVYIRLFTRPLTQLSQVLLPCSP